MSLNISLPFLAIFGLEHLLIPYWLYEVKLPLTKDSDGKIIDQHGGNYTCIEDVPEIFEQLRALGIKIGVICETVYVSRAHLLMYLLGWDDYVTYKEIDDQHITDQIVRMHNISHIKYSDMIYFDAYPDNLYYTHILGVHTVLVTNGITMDIFENNTRKFYENRTSVKLKNNTTEENS